MWVYQISEINAWGKLYTVGFYDPLNRWNPESDHDTIESAAQRVNYLNGHQ